MSRAAQPPQQILRDATRVITETRELKIQQIPESLLNDAQAIGGLIGLGFIWMTPVVADMMKDWLKAPLYWQSYAREIEDKLSDALHERLTQRFIDRRTSVLMKRLAQKEELMSTVEEDGAIHVEGEYIGRIKGFLFVPDGAAEGAEAAHLGPEQFAAFFAAEMAKWAKVVAEAKIKAE